eukprot:TRINITY_DN18442_c0_g1_i1.p1 TRINITY_DN18442_c0_g1~~TRINITY_DN18442_c0_g1_i1.p1  ORF type:complete len:268 (+),score=41.87 TRINITY_DN18442_c0_g1_i1:130-933(+)
MSQWEIFTAVKNNDIKKLRDLVDSGVDINLVDDLDSGATPLLIAASNGSKHCMELLLSRGANVNQANARGVTPLHNLISKRFDSQAVWLIMQGADLNKPDNKGHTPRDLAHTFFQKDLDDAAAAYSAKINPVEPKAPSPVVERRLPQEELTILLANGAQCPQSINASTTTAEVLNAVTASLHMASLRPYLELWEISRGDNQEQRKRRVGESEAPSALKAQWRMVIGPSGNETGKFNYFILVPRRGVQAELELAYTTAIQAYSKSKLS